MRRLVRFGLLLLTVGACSEEPRLDPNGPIKIVGDTIIVGGKIDADLASSVINALNQNDSLTTMLISSPGGDAQAGMAIGLAVHQARLDVTVRGVCASACAQYVFVAGDKKRVEEGSIIALHSSPSAMEAVLEKSPYRTQSYVFSEVATTEALFYQEIEISAQFPLIAASQMTPTCALKIANEAVAAAEQYGVGWAASAFVPSPAQLGYLGVENVEGNWPSPRGLRDDLIRLGFSPDFKPVYNQAAKLSTDMPAIGVCEFTDSPEK